MTALGPSNPKDLGAAELPLHACSGQVYSISRFVSGNLDALDNGLERDMVGGMSDRLARETDIPAALGRCLCRSEEFAISARPHCLATRSGARSAYWQEQNFKLKGCRPVLDASQYPLERLPFGAMAIEHTHIPFGILSRQGVMREILAYCFLLKHGVPPQGTPVCVYEYVHHGRPHGFCLVSKTVGETRLEEFVEYPELTVADLIAARTAALRGGQPWGSELNLRTLNIWWHAEQKSRLLIAMHFAGGHRGILNSNIGNDVVVLAAEHGPATIYLCDFDSFTVLAVPDRPSWDFLKAFVLQCLIEVVKGSVSILEYLEMPEDLLPAERGTTLSRVYFAKSSLWRAYERRLFASARTKGWDAALVQRAVDEAVRSEALADVLGECVLNSHSLRMLDRNRGVYYPHN
jgi:hypothetical protein